MIRAATLGTQHVIAILVSYTPKPPILIMKAPIILTCMRGHAASPCLCKISAARPLIQHGALLECFSDWPDVST